MIYEALKRRGWNLAREESDGEPALWTKGNPVAVSTESALFQEMIDADAAKRHAAATAVSLLKAAHGAWHLCQSLLAVREGATDELIIGVRDALHSAVVQAGIEHYPGMPESSSAKPKAEG